MDTTLHLIFGKEEETFEECQRNISALSAKEWIDNKEQTSENGLQIHCSILEPKITHNGHIPELNGSHELDANGFETEDVPCEELGAGLSSGSLIMNALGKDSIVPKVDNFIDVSDDNDDDDFGDDGDDDNDDHYDPSGTYHHSHHSKDCEGNRANDFAVDSSASFRCASNFQLQSSNEIYQEKNLRCAGSAFDCEVIMVNRMREDDELPGEVADIAVDSAKVHPRVTNIPIKTKAKAEVNGGSKCDGNDEYSTEPTRLNLSNVVEEFLLDEDFDYDNVELTPKFSMPQINASM